MGAVDAPELQRGMQRGRREGGECTQGDSCVVTQGAGNDVQG